MCGIVGIIGKSARDVVLNGLKKLEYRGYDSAGIYLNDLNGHEYLTKAVGRIKNLEDKLSDNEQGLVLPILIRIIHLISVFIWFIMVLLKIMLN